MLEINKDNIFYKNKKIADVKISEELGYSYKIYNLFGKYSVEYNYKPSKEYIEIYIKEWLNYPEAKEFLGIL